MNYLLSLLLVLSMLSCSTLEDPDTVQPSDMIFVKSGRNSLRANGRDTTYIIARIPVDAGNVDISFSASSGKFPKSGGQSISEYASQKDDIYRYATVLFQSDSMRVDSVWITAELTQARSRCKLSFVN